MTHHAQPSVVDQVLSLNSITADHAKRLARLEANYLLLRARISSLSRSAAEDEDSAEASTDDT